MDPERRPDRFDATDEPQPWEGDSRDPSRSEGAWTVSRDAAEFAWYGSDWVWDSADTSQSASPNGNDAPPLTVDVPQRSDDAIRWRALLREVAETLLMTVLIFVLVRGLLVQNFRIEGFSMEPTLHEGQYLIVNKLVYYLHPPRRGDIIVFAFPRGPERDFIKRVIGVPGDTVEIRPGQILVNGEVIQEPYNPEPVNYSYPPTTLGSNEYFVLGDNRNNSSDSHTWGVLERKYIIGKAWLSYWPPKEWGLVPNYAVQAREPDMP